jgi:hypothetical protein
LRLDGLGLDPEACEILSAYINALGEELPGGRRARSMVLAEIADGLVCAVEAREADGLSSGDAANVAVKEFGEVDRVVSAFARQMLSTTTHRTGLALVLSGPIVGLIWASVWGADASTWSGRIDAVLSAVRGLPLLLVLIIPCAVLAASAGGWLGRMIKLPTHWTYATALIATGGCVAVDTTMVAAAVAGHGLAQASVTLLVSAVVASVLRASAAGVAMRRLVCARAASN